MCSRPRSFSVQYHRTNSLTAPTRKETGMASQQSQELARRAGVICEQRLRAQLEHTHPDEFVAIEPDSGDYFLGRTLSDAIQAARSSASCASTIHPARRTQGDCRTGGDTLMRDTFSCVIDWFGQERVVEVVEHDGHLPLLGVGLLWERKLEIEYPLEPCRLRSVSRPGWRFRRGSFGRHDLQAGTPTHSPGIDQPRETDGAARQIPRTNRLMLITVTIAGCVLVVHRMKVALSRNSP